MGGGRHTSSAARADGAAEVNPTDGCDHYSLAPAQEAMLSETLRAPGSGVNIQQVVLRVEEELDIAAMQEAWRHVVAIHPALRTSFAWDGVRKPIQRVHPYAEAVLARRDWREFPPESLQRELDAFLREDRAAGFDLVRPPLRLTILRCGRAACDMVVTFHHLLLDGRSRRRLLAEVEDAYCQIRAGRCPAPREDRAYRAYLAGLDRREAGDSEPFWRELLEGFEAPTLLGVDPDAPGQALGSSWYEQASLRLSQELTQVLRALAQEHGLTLNTLIQGAWALLLSRYNRENDVVFGAIWETRPRDIEGLDTSLGLFINTLPTRVRLRGDITLLALLQDLRAQHLAGRPHRSCSLRQIRKACGMTGDRPLFESLVNFQRTAWDAPHSASAGRWRPLRLLQRPNFPLVLNSYDGQELELELLYDAGRFAPGAMRQMLAHLRRILAAIARDAAQPLARVDLLASEERQRVLVEWNRTAADYPRDQCIHQIFEVQARLSPSRVAVFSDGQSLTYGQLNQRADRLADRLRAAGVRRGRYVGLYLKRSADLIVGMLAILKSGGAYVPLEISWK